MSDVRAARQAKLEQLRRKTTGANTTASSSSDGDIYTLVPDDVYRDVVRSRLAEDDFIEDDMEGSGYVDNGMDDWDRDDGVAESDEEEERRARKKAKAKAKEAEVAAKPKPKPRGRAPVAVPTEANPYKRVVDVQKEDDFMSGLLGDLGSTSGSSKTSSRVPSLTTSSSASSLASLARKRKAQTDDFGSVLRSSVSNSFMSGGRVAPSSDSDLGAKKLRIDGDDHSFDASMNDYEPLDYGPVDVKPPDDPIDDGPDEELAIKSTAPSAAASAPRRRQLVNVANNAIKPRAAPALKLEVDESKPTKPKGMDWRLAAESVNVLDAKAAELDAPPEEDDSANVPMTKKARAKLEAAGGARVGLSKVNAFEANASLRFYWLDAQETDGVVHLFGKVLDKDTGKHVSACLTINGIERNVFVLPKGAKSKAKKAEDEPAKDDDDANSQYSADWDSVDGDAPSQDEVYEEIDTICTKHCISKFAGKFVQRKYAFELRGVPADAEWLKIAYPFDQPALPMDLTGSTFTHVLGTNTSAFELFVLKRKIMGPCWLDVRDAELTDRGTSWCKFEAVVKDPKSVNPFAETDAKAPRETPPLTIMSLSVRAIMNLKDNRREVVCATAHVWQDASLDDTTPIERQPCSVHTVIRPLGTATGSAFPKGFEEAAKASKSKIVTMKAERMLLNNLLATIHRFDADVIIGHDFVGSSLDVLLNRMKDLKADHWSRIGRVRQTKWGRLGAGRNSNRNADFLRGRLVCDLKSEVMKGFIPSTTWSMSELCSTHLKVDREDIDPDDTADYFDAYAASPDRLMEFVQHNSADSYFQMAIAHKVQALPLTKQLCTLAGISWSRGLTGFRSERNEYILLHEFHRQKYICPDKMSAADRKKAEKAAAAAAAVEGDDDVENAATTTGGGGKQASKKDKYKGGLVFDPKRGLHDKFILVMDFNSLYPSIIQEYNIDFTTVERNHLDPDDLDKLPELPSSDLEQGVLPRLIATLVQRRRQVKGLMKDKTATQAQLMQWDIRQLALKLTANSMYGCLGLEGSRFSARPLAALTTSKGREILSATKDLAEAQSLEVIYGDTDSVMINTGMTEYAAAMQIGMQFKRLVNERYRLLEIDIDNVFARMLLLQKKKYAALKIDESGATEQEIKGLDMKRREFSELNKSVSREILTLILSGNSTEMVVEQIHDFLTTINEGVRGGKVDLIDFIINKRLSKNPSEYTDIKSQPHVQVALRMIARGQSAKAGDVIPYIICLADDGSSTTKGGADRARHPDEIRRSEGALKVDYEYYLSQQVLHPIRRLTSHIEGSEEARLAECLGLNVHKHIHTNPEGLAEREFTTLDSQMTDADRFREVDELRLKCRHCATDSLFGGLLDDKAGLVQPDGLRCGNITCLAPLDTASVLTQVELEIRSHIARFYAGWLVCDDTQCGSRTRMMSVLGRRCLRPTCRGTMRFEYSDARLYTQLLFYDHLFNADKARQRAIGTSKQDEVTGLAMAHAGSFATVQAVIDRYMTRCGRRWISLGNVFSFMRSAQ